MIVFGVSFDSRLRFLAGDLRLAEPTRDWDRFGWIWMDGMHVHALRTSQHTKKMRPADSPWLTMIIHG